MVTVDIIHGVAVFEDTIKNKAILTLNLKVIKTHSELGALLSDLMRHEWFTQEMRYKIEREVIRFLHEF